MKPIICILTAGRGTRLGAFCESLNKALLPLGQKAAITRIIENFPDESEFVIAIGHLGELVRDFLEISYPERRFTFVDVENYEGPGSGPGHSLVCCSKFLQRPFYFVSCDTMWSNKLDFTKTDEDWFGVSAAKSIASESAAYCNFGIKDKKIISIHDKQAVSGDEFRPFVGLCFIKNFQTFWDGLKHGGLIKGEAQVSTGITALVNSKTPPIAMPIEWNDIGTYEKYQTAMKKYEGYDFSKNDEAIYICNGKVVKFFANDSVIEKRVKKVSLNPKVFPKIVDRRKNLYSYRFVTGKTLYEYNNPETFKGLLAFLDESLWKPVKVDQAVFEKACQKFYKDKTFERLQAYYEKYKITDGPSRVKGKDLPLTSKLLEKVDWSSLFKGNAVFMHGDLNFGNIIYNPESKEFSLLDWRQDFGGHVEFGDIYYDFAKLYAGIVMNFEDIRAGRFTYTEEIDFEFGKQAHQSEYLAILDEFLTRKGFDAKRARVLAALTYLNMAPLHHYPFDKLLYSLSRLLLNNELMS